MELKEPAKISIDRQLQVCKCDQCKRNIKVKDLVQTDEERWKCPICGNIVLWKL